MSVFLPPRFWMLTGTLQAQMRRKVKFLICLRLRPSRQLDSMSSNTTTHQPESNNQHDDSVLHSGVVLRRGIVPPPGGKSRPRRGSKSRPCRPVTCTAGRTYLDTTSCLDQRNRFMNAALDGSLYSATTTIAVLPQDITITKQVVLF